MGQSSSAARAVQQAQPQQPIDVRCGRLRADYMTRLGIQRGCSDAVRPSTLKQQRVSRTSSTSTCESDGWFDSSCDDEPTANDQIEQLVETCGDKNVLRIRSHDFRLPLLQKLSYHRVWVPPAQRKPRHQTVIIFDWDDTLLCTSSLHINGHEEAMPFLPGIQNAARHLLEMAGRMGQVFIITNAMHGWVEHSAAKYLPGLLPVLRDVRIISARGKYEADYPNDAGQWKIHAFMEVKRGIDSEAVANLVSVGDSCYEMDAADALGKAFEQARTKTIKLREVPSPKDLLKQLELVTQKFEQIVESGRDLRIALERRSAARTDDRRQLSAGGA